MILALADRFLRNEVGPEEVQEIGPDISTVVIRNALKSDINRLCMPNGGWQQEAQRGGNGGRHRGLGWGRGT